MTREEAGALHWDPIRRPAPLLFQSFFAGAGLLGAWFFPDRLVLLLALLAAVVGSVRLLEKQIEQKWAWGIAVCIAFYLYGGWTYHQMPTHDLRYLDLPLPRTVELRLIPEEEPAWKPGRHGEQVGNAVCRVIAINPGDGWRPAEGKVWARIHGDPASESFYGIEAIAGGYLELPPLPESPGQFDFSAYLSTTGVYHVFSAHLDDWEFSSDFKGWRLLKWANSLRLYMVDVLQWGLDPESPWPGLMAGMLFGYRDGISAEMMNEFQVTGTLHLFAVSGQNVGMILWVFLVFLRSFGLIKWRWGWLVAPGLLMFCLSTGLESSASRALVMIILVLAGWWLYRPVTPLNLLGAAALILWAWDPWQMLDVGFQLSFLVLLALLLCTMGLARWLYHPFRPDTFIPRDRLPSWRKWLDGVYGTCSMLVAGSTVAWLASLPLIWFHFGLVSPITVLSNCVVVPLAGAVVILALLSVLSSVALPVLAVGLNLLNAKILMVMTVMISSLAALPGGHFYWSRDADLDEDAYKLTVLSGSRHAPLILETGRFACLIGVGTAREWKYLIDPARRYLGLESFDSITVLQANNRHLGGLEDLLTVMPVKDLVIPPHPSRSPAFRNWQGFRSEHVREFCSIREVSRADLLFEENSVKAHVLWPEAVNAGWNSENAGLVVLLELDGVKVLVGGNLSQELERELINRFKIADIDILVQGPHSRDPGLSFSWLKKIKPEVIIRPSSGFYPEQDLPMEKRDWFRKTAIRLIELDHAGALQIRGSDGAFRILTWSQETQEFTDEK